MPGNALHASMPRPELQLPAAPFAHRGQDIRVGNPLRAHLNDRRTVSGTLISLQPDRDRLTMRISSGRRLKLELSRLDYLRFGMPLVPAEGEGALKRAVPFRVRFHSGGEIHGNTLGALHTLTGLTLFRLEDDGIHRLFLPATSIASKSVGKPLGEELVEGGHASASDVNAVVEKQNRSAGEQDSRMRLGEQLVETGELDGDSLARSLAAKLGLQYLTPEELKCESAAIERVPASIAREYSVLPLNINAHRMRVATSEPTSPHMINVVQFLAERPLEVCVSAEDAIREHLDRAYGGSFGTASLNELEVQIAGEDDEHRGEHASTELLERLSNEKPVVRFVNALLMEAIDRRASDIHIRPTRKGVDILYRIDGMLLPARQAAAKLHSALVSRIKILGGMDIAERRIPQDGRLEVHHRKHKVDLRVSIMPTVDGESVVIRLLDTSQSIKSIGELGLTAEDTERVNDMISRNQGMFLVTGPTGSGKSTTLYAALGAVREKPVNVMTVEDPVEYHMTGVEQIQVNPAVDLTFPRALRNILRHDPDVIMVGEIRDEETARIAMKSALTGHLVLSTLHTNSAVRTIARLVDMNVERFLIQSTVLGILAQRLLRRTCPHCSEETTPTRRQAATLQLEETEMFRQGRGCSECHNTGYKGRVVTYELLAADPRLRKAINDGVEEGMLEQIAREGGMVPLTDHALSLARQGKTSLEEVVRVRLD